MPPKASPLTIPKYNGGSDDVPVRKWLRLFEMKADTAHWQPQDMIQNFSDYVEGDAFHWYLNEIFDTCETWDDIKTRMTLRFSTAVADPFRSFIHYRQKKDQSIASYYDEKRKLGELADLKDRHITSGLTDGLLPDFELALAGLNIESPAEWFNAAQRVELALARQNRRNWQPQQPYRRGAPGTEQFPSQHPQNALQAPTIPKTECRHCKLIGLHQQFHWQSACPNRQSVSALDYDQGNESSDPRFH